MGRRETLGLPSVAPQDDGGPRVQGDVPSSIAPRQGQEHGHPRAVKATALVIATDAPGT
jgi:hypothetical protein